jgi:hypothetical protein
MVGGRSFRPVLRAEKPGSAKRNRASTCTTGLGLCGREKRVREEGIAEASEGAFLNFRRFPEIASGTPLNSSGFPESADKPLTHHRWIGTSEKISGRHLLGDDFPPFSSAYGIRPISSLSSKQRPEIFPGRFGHDPMSFRGRMNSVRLVELRLSPHLIEHKGDQSDLVFFS